MTCLCPVYLPHLLREVDYYEWISIKDRLPDKSYILKVKYKMVDGKEDVGYFQDGE